MVARALCGYPIPDSQSTPTKNFSGCKQHIEPGQVCGILGPHLKHIWCIETLFTVEALVKRNRVGRAMVDPATGESFLEKLSAAEKEVILKIISGQDETFVEGLRQELKHATTTEQHKEQQEEIE